MERRFLLAFILSLLVLLGYPYLISKVYGPLPSQKEPLPPSKTTRPLPEALESLPLESTPVVPSEKEPTAPPLFLETEKMIVAIHPNEGSIQSVSMKDYLDKNGEPLELVKVGGVSNSIGNLWFKTPNIEWILYREVEQNAQRFVFQGVSAEGLIQVEKRVELTDSPYILKLSYSFKNLSENTLPLYYQLVALSRLYPDEKRFFEAVVFTGGKRRAFHAGKVPKKGIVSDEDPQWVALKEKYFSIILSPAAALSGYAVSTTEDGESLVFRVGSVPQTLPPKGELKESFQIYLGPNRLSELKKLSPWAETVVDYGMFGGITKMMLWALTHIQKGVKNYGLSIILLTVIVSILLLPLSGVSYKSMQRMKLIQPEMNKLRELYKDNPQKMNKEIMALYKKHKVNPLGGCLPMLIQMPIFIAFYQALIHSIELKGAPFLFIKDLSLPDRAIPLPFQLGPLGSAINILPILMMLAMYLQQKLMSPGPAPTGPEGETQRMMTTMMPFIFGVIFYGLPSGLVLYWLTNNIVMIITQKFFLSRGVVS